MPYIPNDKRTPLDPVIDDLVNVLVKLATDDEANNFEGNLNYSITRLLRKCYGESYRDINDAIGMLECVKLEHYRTKAVPYEEQKKFENGDVEVTTAPILLNEVVVEKKDE